MNSISFRPNFQTPDDEPLAKKRKMNHHKARGPVFLPNETLLIIFAFLGSEKGAFALSKVSYQFYKTAQCYPPVKLANTISNVARHIMEDPTSFGLISMPCNSSLQEQFAAIVLNIDPSYVGTQKLLEPYYSSLRNNNSFCDLIPNNPFLFSSLLKSNGLMLSAAGSKVKENLDLLEEAVKQNKQAFQFVPSHLQQKIRETIEHKINLLFIEVYKSHSSFESIETIENHVIQCHPWVKLHLNKRDALQDLEDLSKEWPL
jgi:hypothetical protein